jgi:AraC-like DNA-binding protein
MPQTAIPAAIAPVPPVPQVAPVPSRSWDLSAAGGGQGASLYVLPRESNWRMPSRSDTGSPDHNRIYVSRWQQHTLPAHQMVSRNDRGSYLIAVNLQSTNASLRQAEQLLFDGPVTPGMIQVTPPDCEAAALFRSSCDVLHLSVPVELVRREHERVNGVHSGAEPWFGEAAVFPDIDIERLARSITGASNMAGPFGYLYVQEIARAIVVGMLGNDAQPKPVNRVNKLPLWRLRRAIDYVEQNLTRPVQLADIAASVGLTSMHFACQFRLSTGFSPHAYLMRRRLEHAQLLLQHPNASVSDVALQCGFSTHAHFSAAFKRHTGYSPLAWRLHC